MMLYLPGIALCVEIACAAAVAGGLFVTAFYIWQRKDNEQRVYWDGYDDGLVDRRSILKDSRR